MAGIDEAFWDQLDARVAATFARAPRLRRLPAAAPRMRAARPPIGDEPPLDRHQVADWTGLVDTIAAAGAAAQVQDTRLRERTVAYDALANDLQRARDDVEKYKALVAQAQAQVEVKTREIQALAEARIEAMQARAEARVQRAEERAQIAERRVGAVETWLSEIEAASRDLLPAAQRMPIAKAS